MGATTDNGLGELIDLLRDRGLDAKLMEERQVEREAEREDLLQRLMAQEAADEAVGNKLNGQETEAKRRLRNAEAAAAEARRELMEMGASRSHIGVTANKLRAKLRCLADPRIERDLRALRALEDKVRGAFSIRTTRTRDNPLKPGRTEVSYSNTIEVGEALAAIKQAVDRLEVLYEQPRPDDLTEFIKGVTRPVYDRVHRLIGIQNE
jgi:hypothetical protein